MSIHCIEDINVNIISIYIAKYIFAANKVLSDGHSIEGVNIISCAV